MTAPMSLSSVSDVTKLEGYCRSMFKKNGSIVGNTREQPVSGEFVIPPSSLNALVDNLRPLLDQDVLEREDHEYAEIQAASVRACSDEFSRDINGRRALVVNSGCVSYQHFFFREGVLFHVVHMRSQDIRKLLADFWLLFTIQRAIVAGCLPEGVVVKAVNLRWTADCFHSYLKPEEVAL